MDNAQPQKSNGLVQGARAAGQAVRAGDMEKLRDLARSLGKAGGTITQDSATTLGNKPSQLTQMTRKPSNQNDANQREITRDRPPPGRGR